MDDVFDCSGATWWRLSGFTFRALLSWFDAEDQGRFPNVLTPYIAEIVL